MGSNVFVSYKYQDGNVAKLGNNDNTICRDYVDEIADVLEERDSYYFRAERDGEDLSKFDETTIMQKLADKMFYTSVTIVLISANMRERGKREKDQWIPWEISYSLREKKRGTGNSGINAILAVAVPDRNGSYGFVITQGKESRTIHDDKFFKIIGKNMFNIRNIEKYQIAPNRYRGAVSYIPIVRWCDFKSNPEHYLAEAENCRNHANDYILVKRIDPSW